MKLNWLAVENGDKGRLLRELGLREVGAADEQTEAHLACALTAKGWLVVVDNSMSLELDRLLPTVSAGGHALGCAFTTVVMFSQAQAWRDGRRAWQVSHDPEEGLRNLSVEGEPPAELTDMAARLAADQEADTSGQVDYMFDAPIDLAKAVCGYHHDDLLSTPWSILAVPPGDGSQAESILPGLIRTELLPKLPSLGWNGPAATVSAIGREFDATRIRNGRLEGLRFLWQDDGRELEITPSVAVVADASLDGEVLGAGRIPLPEARVRRGLGEMLRQIGKPKPLYEERVRNLLDHTLNMLPSLDQSIDERLAKFSDQHG